MEFRSLDPAQIYRFSYSPIRQIYSCMHGDFGGQQRSTPVAKEGLRSLEIVLSLDEPAYFLERFALNKVQSANFVLILRPISGHG